MAAHLFLLLALLALALLGILHKLADRARCRPAPITVFLFFWAGCMAATAGVVFRGGWSVLEIPLLPFEIAVVCGLFAAGAIVSFQHAVRFGKISTSWLLINLSTAIPTVLSIVVYREEVGWQRGASLALAIAALILLWMDRKREAPAPSQPSGLAADAGQSRP